MRFVPVILLLSSLASLNAHASSEPPPGRVLDRAELARAGTQAKAGSPHATRIIDLGTAFQAPRPRKAVAHWRGHRTTTKVATFKPHHW